MCRCAPYDGQREVILKLALMGLSPATTRDSEGSVQRRLAGWPCLPAAMHPEPLIRITPDDVLNNTGELCRVGYDVCFVISGANQLDCWIETQYVFTKLRIPHRKCRHHGGVGAQGNTGEPAGCICRNAEEIHEHSLRRGHVRVHEDAYGFSGVHGREQAADEITFIHGAIAVHGAI